MGSMNICGVSQNRKEELEKINRTTRELLELIDKKEEHRTLTAELRMMIEKNEVEIFELMKQGGYVETIILLSAR